MTIESTAHLQARHKPRAQQKRIKKEYPAAVVKIVKEPAQSHKNQGWYYFWGKHVNSGRDDWAILCTEEQVSWVVEQMESNVQLTEGFHFSSRRMKCENGYETRDVLDEQFYLDEPEPEQDPPMHWAKPGNEVPVVQDEPPKVPPADPEVMRRMNTWFRVLAECGVEPSPDRIAETAAGFTTSVEISKERRGNR